MSLGDCDSVPVPHSLLTFFSLLLWGRRRRSFKSHSEFGNFQLIHALSLSLTSPSPFFFIRHKVRLLSLIPHKSVKARLLSLSFSLSLSLSPSASPSPLSLSLSPHKVRLPLSVYPSNSLMTIGFSLYLYQSPPLSLSRSCQHQSPFIAIL